MALLASNDCIMVMPVTSSGVRLLFYGPCYAIGRSENKWLLEIFKLFGVRTAGSRYRRQTDGGGGGGGILYYVVRA